MNKYLKSFLHRGLVFGGFGPMVVGIVLFCIDIAGEAVALSGGQFLLAVISSYLLAFVQAGASVFNQIESWSTPKALACHFSLLFVAYSLTYISNSWIPFEPAVLLIFSAIFIAVYLVVWFSVYFIVRSTSGRMNTKIKG